MVGLLGFGPRDGFPVSPPSPRSSVPALPENEAPPAARRKSGDLLPRLVTALVLGPLLLAAAIVGPNLLVWLIVVVAALIGNLEYTRMTVANGRARLVRGVSAVGTVATLSLLYWVDPEAAVMAFAACLLGVMLAELATVRDPRHSAGRIGGGLSGFVYATVLFGSLLVLAQGEHPGETAPHQGGWFMFPMFVVWMGDTGAYFAGRAFGKRKLAPVVSPGKSWEGAAGGLVASVVGGYLCWWLLLDGAGVAAWHVLLFAVPGAILGQLGDLCESLIKRSTGFKDSGAILYGHGGMLDRVDALLFAAPWFVLVKSLLDLG